MKSEIVKEIIGKLLKKSSDAINAEMVLTNDIIMTIGDSKGNLHLEVGEPVDLRDDYMIYKSMNGDMVFYVEYDKIVLMSSASENLTKNKRNHNDFLNLMAELDKLTNLNKDPQED